MKRHYEGTCAVSSGACGPAVVDAGIEALRRLSPDWSGGYVCPLCLRGFTNPKDLTREDVPPKSVGGHPLVLTCVSCNSASGHTVDAHAAKRERFRAIARRDMRRATRAMVVTREGDRIPVDFMHAGAVATMAVANKASSKRAQSNLEELFRRRSVDNQIELSLQLQLTAVTHDTRLARVSWLRAAYLVAFAALGYRYIFGPELEQVREQVRLPQTRLLDRFCVESSERMEPFMAAIAKPEWLTSLAVGFEHFLVFLPLQRAGLYADLSARREPQEHVAYEGQRFVWPRRPTFSWDLGGKFLAGEVEADADQKDGQA